MRGAGLRFRRGSQYVGMGHPTQLEGGGQLKNVSECRYGEPTLPLSAPPLRLTARPILHGCISPPFAALWHGREPNQMIF